jgi:hypothetical protein
MSCVDSVWISSGGLLRRVSEFWSSIAERDRGAEICVGRLDISSPDRASEPGRGGDWSSIKSTSIQPTLPSSYRKKFPKHYVELRGWKCRAESFIGDTHWAKWS